MKLFGSFRNIIYIIYVYINSRFHLLFNNAVGSSQYPPTADESASTKWFSHVIRVHQGSLGNLREIHVWCLDAYLLHVFTQYMILRDSLLASITELSTDLQFVLDYM